jgi:hypothetical protein
MDSAWKVTPQPERRSTNNCYLRLLRTLQGTTLVATQLDGTNNTLESYPTQQPPYLLHRIPSTNKKVLGLPRDPTKPPLTKST